MPSRTLLNPGDRIGHYRVVQHIADGGFGSVYLVHDSGLGRDIALKVLDPRRAAGDDDEFLVRFQREARAMAQLQHPNIVQVYEVGYDAALGLHYFTMEYLPKGTLEQELADYAKRGRRMTERQALEIARQIVKALQFAHDGGVVHRDLKPSNILRAKDGRYVLVDFGLVKPINSSRGETIHSASIFGSPRYISPEQASGDPVDVRTDLYSLGIILFELFAGTPPFRGKNTATLLAEHLTKSPPLHEINRLVSPGSARLVKRLLAKSRAQRPRSARHVQRALERLPSRTVPFIVCIGLGLAALGAMGFFWWSLIGPGQKPGDNKPTPVSTPSVRAVVTLPLPATRIVGGGGLILSPYDEGATEPVRPSPITPKTQPATATILVPTATATSPPAPAVTSAP